MRVTDKKAKELVDDLKGTGDIIKFIEKVSYLCGYYSRYSRKPRENFTSALVTELITSRLDFYFAPDPIYVLVQEDIKGIAKDYLERELTKEELMEATRIVRKSGIAGWDECIEVAIDMAVEEIDEENKEARRENSR